jgi:hypothetical protein
MREVVHQAGGDLSEHRLALLPAHVGLQLDQPVSHRVERIGQLGQLVLPADRHALLEAAVGERQRPAPQREHAPDEAAAPDDAERDRDEEGEADRDEELAFELARDRVRLARRLLDDDRPAERFHERAGGQHGVLALGVFLRWLAARAQLCRHRVLLHDAAARDVALLIRVPVRQEPSVVADERRVALPPDANLVDHAPELLEAQLADEPAARLVLAGRQLYGDGRGRQEVVIDRDA